VRRSATFGVGLAVLAVVVLGAFVGTTAAPDVRRADAGAADLGRDETARGMSGGEVEALPGGGDDVADVKPAGEQESITVVWSAEGLDGTLVSDLAGHAGVSAATRVRSATVGLLGSLDADGAPRDVLPPGFRIPVTLAALEADGYSATLGAVPDEDAALLAQLAPGQVLLSASSAALRGLAAGATVELGAAGEGQLAGLRVIGVVADRTARGSEFLAHAADAEAIGLGPRESLIVRHASARAEELAELVAQRRDDDVRLRQDRQHVQLVLPHTELKARFGEFAFRMVPGQREVDMDRAFADEHITIERMPVLGNVRCHRLIMDDLRSALEEIVDAGLEEWLAPRRYGGCYHARRIRTGRENLSRHSWGVAIDLNVDFSMPGAGPVPPDEFIAIMGRHGFRWGGDFASSDNHHYEWVGEAARIRPARDVTLRDAR